VVPIFGENLGGVRSLAKWVIFRAPSASTELIDFVLDGDHGVDKSIYLGLWF
jgi:hypothetical protein